MRSIIEVNVKPVDYSKYFQITLKMVDTDKTVPIKEKLSTEILEIYPSDTLLYTFCKCLMSMVEMRLLNP